MDDAWKVKSLLAETLYQNHVDLDTGVVAMMTLICSVVQESTDATLEDTKELLEKIWDIVKNLDGYCPGCGEKHGK